MIEIYADGAYSSSRDMGGWAFVVLNDGEKIESMFFPEAKTTNNRMEIKSVIEACKWCLNHEIKEFKLYTDSMYVIGTMTRNWKRNKNNDLWDILDSLVKDFRISWLHVKGHSGNKFNELCDALAVQATFIT